MTNVLKVIETTGYLLLAAAISGAGVVGNCSGDEEKAGAEKKMNRGRRGGSSAYRNHKKVMPMLKQMIDARQVRECRDTGKLSHLTIEAAEDHRRRLALLTGGGESDYDIYPCFSCCGWHCGHRPHDVDDIATVRRR